MSGPLQWTGEVTKELQVQSKHEGITHEAANQEGR